MSLSRREFFNRTAGAGLGIALIGSFESLFTAPNALGAPAKVPGYGPLVNDPNGKLALPEGFSYKIVTQAGVTKLDSGEPSPGTHDGTGAFERPGGGTTLVLNHEIRGTSPNNVPHADGLVYDPSANGGCTIVDVDKDGNLVNETVGIAGTSTNCAGGITPWGTWLTCEETEDKVGQNGSTKPHGYVFEVHPFDRAANQNPQPIKCLGRYPHEACCVDPKSGEIYLTEDAKGPFGLLYKWTPPAGYKAAPGVLKTLDATAGALEAMRATDKSGNYVDDLSRVTEVGTTLKTEWIAVPDRDAATVSTRKQSFAKPVTRGQKLEGAWWGDHGAYIVASFGRTADGSAVAHDGQLWFVDPSKQTMELRLRFGINPNYGQDGAFDGPDNITVSPWGGVIMAEDGEGVQHLIGVNDKGEAYQIARNQIDENEFTGPVFSPDKRTLFANAQTPGIMYAITGPWQPNPKF
ncbi:alkaline phosphatase PhoX [Smaragdicoccus niigatensis]|uniref:alkaline phosphatase PhoX n=1 Tax=Smaragdicoccus niigatensis TaxID=359359 RepID=UPI000378323E|nr:alkaline phosphatase PhoX [Smaragdicoccus niigatensis]